MITPTQYFFVNFGLTFLAFFLNMMCGRSLWIRFHLRNKFPIIRDWVGKGWFVQAAYDPEGWWMTDHSGNRVHYYISFARIKDRKSALIARNLIVFRLRITWSKLLTVPFAGFTRVKGRE